MPRRQNFAVLMVIGLAAFIATSFVLTFRNQAEGTRHPDYVASYREPIGEVDPSLLHGAASAPKLENATLKCVSASPNYKILRTLPNNLTEQNSATQLGRSSTQ